jgi:hypothetical protein
MRVYSIFGRLPSSVLMLMVAPLMGCGGISDLAEGLAEVPVAVAEAAACVFTSSCKPSSDATVDRLNIGASVEQTDAGPVKACASINNGGGLSYDTVLTGGDRMEAQGVGAAVPMREVAPGPILFSEVCADMGPRSGNGAYEVRFVRGTERYSASIVQPTPPLIVAPFPSATVFASQSAIELRYVPAQDGDLQNSARVIGSCRYSDGVTRNVSLNAPIGRAIAADGSRSASIVPASINAAADGATRPPAGASAPPGPAPQAQACSLKVSGLPSPVP